MAAKSSDVPVNERRGGTGEYRPPVGLFGEWIDEFCKRQNWSFNHFAKMTGLNVARLSPVRVGQDKPTRAILKKILELDDLTRADRVKVSTAWIGDLFEEIGR